MENHARLGRGRRHFLKVAGAGIGLASFAGCTGGGDGGDGGGGDGSGDGGDGGSTGDGGDSAVPIVVAGLEPQSGPFSVYGPRHLAGAEYAIEQINAEGRLLGRELEIKAVDSKSEPQTVLNEFTRLVEQQGAVGVVGPVSSGAGINASNRAEEMEIPMFLHAAGASEILSKVDRYSFRTALPPVPTEVRSQLQLIEEHGLTEIGIIYEDGAYGQEFRAAVAAYFPDDLNLTTDEAPIQETNMIPYLRQMPSDVEMILGTAHPAAISTMYPQVVELGMDLELYTAAITATEVDYGAVADAIDESFVSHNSPDVYSESFQQVASQYYEDTGGFFDMSQANGYVSIQLIADSITKAESADPQDIAAATREESHPTDIYARPIEYTEWGELDGVVQIHNSFDVEGSLDWYPENEYALEEYFRTDPLPPYEPGSLDLPG